MLIIMLIPLLFSMVTDEAILRLGTFGCFVASFSRKTELKSILVMFSAICRDWIWGWWRSSICDTYCCSQSAQIGAFFNAKGVEGAGSLKRVVGGCREGRRGG